MFVANHWIIPCCRRILTTQCSSLGDVGENYTKAGDHAAGCTPRLATALLYHETPLPLNMPIGFFLYPKSSHDAELNFSTHSISG